MDEEESSALEIGRRLYEERIHHRLSVEEVADALRIRRDYVVALEQGNWQNLPGEIYAQGFCRSYARLLDLDADGLLASRQIELDDRGEAPPSRRVRTSIAPAAERSRTRVSRRRVARRRPTLTHPAQRPEVPQQGLAWLLAVIVLLLASGLWLLHR
jgi:cytoskeletal protein RodZ